MQRGVTFVSERHFFHTVVLLLGKNTNYLVGIRVFSTVSNKHKNIDKVKMPGYVFTLLLSEHEDRVYIFLALPPWRCQSLLLAVHIFEGLYVYIMCIFLHSTVSTTYLLRQSNFLNSTHILNCNCKVNPKYAC